MAQLEKILKFLWIGLDFVRDRNLIRTGQDLIRAGQDINPKYPKPIYIISLQLRLETWLLKDSLKNLVVKL